jgi:hypothetical protein
MPRTNRGDALRAEAASEQHPGDPLAPRDDVPATAAKPTTLKDIPYAGESPPEDKDAEIARLRAQLAHQQSQAVPRMTAIAAQASNKPAGYWTVFDSLAKDTKRVHQPVLGKDYALHATEPCYMPPEHAMKFLCDEAFRVFDDQERAVKAVPKVNVEASTGGILLQPGQVVATIDELTDNALKARCAQLPKGHTIAASGDRVAMLRHIAGEQIADVKRKEALMATTDDAKIINEQSGGLAERLAQNDIERLIPSTRLQELLKG